MMQKTLAQPVSYTGIGLHSGQPVSIRFNPAAIDSGICFVRVDLPDTPSVRACAAAVTSSMRATTLEEGTAKVFTVEHVLAALSAMGIDNCRIEMDSAEPPVADGSAMPFVELVRQAGIMQQDKKKKIIAVTQPLIVRRDDNFIAIFPYDGFRITFTSVNPHPLLGVQFGDYEINEEVFCKEVAPARTIGFMHEVEYLKSQGLALGGSLENAVVYDDTDVLTPLRFSDELVRHKILDVIGDLSLAGIVRGHVVAVKSGHALNTALALEIAKNVKGVD